MNKILQRLKEPSTQIVLTLLAVVLAKEVDLALVKEYEQTLTYVIMSIGGLSAAMTPEGKTDD